MDMLKVLGRVWIWLLTMWINILFILKDNFGCHKCSELIGVNECEPYGIRVLPGYWRSSMESLSIV